MLKEDHHHRYFNNLSRVITGIVGFTLIVPGAIIMELAPALALDGSDAGALKSVPPKSLSSGQEALRVGGAEDLRTGNIQASVTALTYAAASGQAIARWKLG